MVINQIKVHFRFITVNCIIFCQVPGLNSWTETSGATIRHCISSDLEQGEKRQREDDEADDHMELVLYPLFSLCICLL